MARINWQKYEDAGVGLSIEERKRLDEEVRQRLLAKKTNPDKYMSRAGMSIGEQEELDRDITTAGVKPEGRGVEFTSAGERGSDFRTDEYMYNAAQATLKDRRGRLTGPLADFKDARSRRYLATYGPGGPLNRMAKGVPAKVRNTLLTEMEPIKKTAVDFVNPVRSAPQYHQAANVWSAIKRSMGKKTPDYSKGRGYKVTKMKSAESGGGVKLAQSQRGCPPPLEPGMFENAAANRPNAASTMYTYGKVYGSENAGYRAAKSSMRDYETWLKRARRI